LLGKVASRKRCVAEKIHRRLWGAQSSKGRVGGHPRTRRARPTSRAPLGLALASSRFEPLAAA